MARQMLRPDRFFPGTCAWSYDDWRDVFYPHALPQNRWLEFYARQFPAVEMDSSFYHVPSARAVKHWVDLVGAAFRFCPKLPKTLSHDKRLEDPAAEIALMRQLADELGPHFGCALLQLPPSFHAGLQGEKALRTFLREWPDGLPLAIEFRHESWYTPHCARVLEERGVAWVWADTHALGEDKRAGFGFLPVTARHLYVRLLGDFRTEYGPDGKETHRYGNILWARETALEHWAVKLQHHADAEAIYVFANNHYEGMAVETMRRLALKLGLPIPSLPVGGRQLELFAGKSPA